MNTIYKQLFVLILAYMMLGFSHVNAETYWGDSNLHLLFTLNESTHEAFLGSNTNERETALYKPALDDPWWTSGQPNLWKNVIVPEKINANGQEYTVVGVTSDAFAYCTQVETVTLPKTIRTIGSRAFKYATYLKSVNISEGVTSIGNSAFEICHELEDITLPSTLESIGASAFFDCHKIESITIPASCTSIGDDAFVGCTGLKDIIIEDSEIPLAFGYNYEVSMMGYDDSYYGYDIKHYRGQFSDCKIENFYLGRPVTCPIVKEKVYPPLRVTGTPAYGDGKSWSNNHKTIKNLTLGNNLKSISDWVFSYVAIKNSDFHIPESVESIGDYAFENAQFGEVLTLPASCSTIGDGAFSETNVKTVICNRATPPTIYKGTFVNINSEKIVVQVPDGSGESYRANPFWNMMIIIDITDQPLTINVSSPGSLGPKIEGKGLTLQGVHSLKVTGTLDEYDWDQIKKMENLHTIDMSELQNTAIPDGAFSSCRIISQVSFPTALESIGSSAFAGCTRLSSNIVFPESLNNIGQEAFCRSSVKSVVINCKYLEIQNSAFSRTSLEEINLEGDIKLGSGVFSSSKLLKATLGNGIKSVPLETFSGCSELQTVYLDDEIGLIGDNAFSNCTNLKTIHLPQSLTSCGTGIFSYCKSIEELNVPGLGTIPANFASDCSSLRKVTFHDGTKVIASKAFYNSPLSDGIVFPSTLVEIQGSAFEGTKLIEVDIPESLSRITGDPLWKKVTTIRVHWDTPINITYGHSFSSTPTLYIPIGTYSKYKNAAYWQSFNIKQEGEIKFDIIGNGTVMINETSVGSGKSSQYFLPYSDVAISAIPADGGQLISFIVDGNDAISELNDEGKYVFEEADENHSIKVVFRDDSQVLVSSITINEKSVTIKEGEDITLSTIITPDNAGEKSVTWSSSNESVAIVSDGVVTAIAEGTATITATTNDGSNLSASCEVTVIESGKILRYTANSKLPETTDFRIAGLRTDAFNTSIKSHTFSKGTGVIIFNKDLTSIGDNAFMLADLTSVTIPNTVTKIGYHAFASCLSLTNVTIGKSVTKIDQGAFENCSGLTSVTIPNSVTEISAQAFWGCSGLTSVTIPGSVTSIYYDAFRDCSNVENLFWDSNVSPSCITKYCGDKLTSVTIGSSVTKIDNSSYSGCGNVKKLIYAEGTKTVLSTGLKSITSVTIPNSVTSIGNDAFKDCSGLTNVTIPNSVTSIGNDAFKDCSGLTNVTIPNSVTSIGNSAFSNCSCLTSVTIPNSVTSIGDGAFSGCSGLISVTIPNSVTKIGSSTFSGCSGLTSVTIPNSVTEIGIEAFKGCDNVKELIYAEGTKTVLSTGLTSITSVTIPNSVTSIGSSAFKGCSGLTSVTIPNSVTKIGDYAFYYCSGLTSVTISESVTSIDVWTFGYCVGLTSVTIPNSVTKIGNYAFYDCSGLASVTIGNSVTSIGSDAFDGCDNVKELIYAEGTTTVLKTSITSITSVTIPNSVTRISSSAFSGCSGLTNVAIPNSVTSIESFAFKGCDNVKELIYAEGTTTVLQTGITSITSVTIPNSVTTIGNRAFCNCSCLTSVTIPNSVTSIGQEAFWGCSGLTNVTIGNSVTKIETVAYKSFDGCDNVKELIYAEGTKTVLQTGITSMTSVTIPNSVTRISSSAFSGCSGLTNVAIPNSVTSIESFAFSGCSCLTSVAIPNSVTKIESSAFENCSGLTSVTIPKSVTSIGSSAFSGCWGLTSVYVEWKEAKEIPTISDRCFLYFNIDLYVPAGTKEIYKSYWRSFKNIIEETVACTSVSLNSESKTLTFGETFNLTVTILPDDATDKSVTWSSDNEDVATVVDGVVTAVAVGTAHITAKTNDGSNLSATCTVTVTSKTSGDEPSGDGPIDNPIYDNMLLTDDIMGFVGETCVLPVKMNNTAEISAVQFDLCLPEGITIAQDEDEFDLVELGERSTAKKHNTIETSVQADGAIRVMCASSKNLTFDGNEGTILYITLNVADNLTDGEYVIKMKDVILSTASSTGYEQPLFASKIKVSSYEMGDLNKDHNINVIDYTAMCSMIMETDGGRYPLELADFSGNGKVDVTDLTALVNKIMTSTASAAKPEMTFKAKTAVAPDANRLSLIPFAINPGETKELSLQMFNSNEISAYQTDLVLPEGIEVAKDDDFYLVELSTERTTAKKHNTMEAELQGDGSIRIMCASMKNFTFSGTEGEVAIITVKASETLKPGVYEIQLKNNVLSTAESSGFEPADCESSALVGSPEIASLSLNGDFTADAIAEYNTALASNTKVAAMDFSNATSIDATTKIATGNKNLIVYVAEGKSIANEDNAVIGDECANLMLTDGYAFCAPKEFTAAKASYTRAATNGLGTLCLPFAAKSVAGNLYELTSAESNKLTFTPVEEVKGNTPYLYRSESAVIEETNAMVEADAECEIVKGDWTMTGAYSVNVFSGEDNVFALYDGKLYKNTGTLTVNPFRAYFTTTGSASKAEIFIDTPTGISNVNVNENDNENIYNINGVRVGKGYRGIVIRNGEKYIMK